MSSKRTRRDSLALGTAKLTEPIPVACLTGTQEKRPMWPYRRIRANYVA